MEENNRLIEQFESHWKVIADTVLSQIRRQLASGQVDLGIINHTLNSETKKWKYGNLSEYLWWEELKKINPQKAEEFALKCDQLQIYAVVGVKVPDSKISTFSGLICGVATFTGMHQFTSWEWFKEIVVAVLVAVIVYMLINVPLVKKKQEQVEFIIKKYSEQLSKMKKELLDACI